MGNQYFYFDYHDGSYGYNTSSSRGADTFFPFNKEAQFTIFDYGRFPTSGQMTGGTSYIIQINNQLSKIIGFYLNYTDSFQGGTTFCRFINNTHDGYYDLLSPNLEYLVSSTYVIDQELNQIRFTTKSDQWYGHGYFNSVIIFGLQ